MGAQGEDIGRVEWPSYVNVGLALCRVNNVRTKEAEVKGRWPRVVNDVIDTVKKKSLKI